MLPLLRPALHKRSLSRPNSTGASWHGTGAKHGLRTPIGQKSDSTVLFLNPLRPLARVRAAAFRRRSQTALPNPVTASSMRLSVSASPSGAGASAASSSFQRNAPARPP